VNEQQIQNQIRAALGELPDVRCLWRNHTGRVQDLNGRWHTFGLAVGGADLVGILTVNGRGIALFIEVKAARGRLSDEQVHFGRAVTNAGAIHIVARSVQDVLDALDRARRDYA
jgi:hypothetical protein